MRTATDEDQAARDKPAISLRDRGHMPGLTTSDCGTPDEARSCGSAPRGVTRGYQSDTSSVRRPRPSPIAFQTEVATLMRVATWRSTIEVDKPSFPISGTWPCLP